MEVRKRVSVLFRHSSLLFPAGSSLELHLPVASSSRVNDYCLACCTDVAVQTTFISSRAFTVALVYDSVNSIMYYVYVYCDPRRPLIANPHGFTHEPFYIGYGKGKRSTFHLREARWNTSTNYLKTNKIRKIQQETQQDPTVIIYRSNLDKNEATCLEVDLIAHYGRLCDKSGILTNITIGGDGNSDHLLSEDVQQKRRVGVAKHLRQNAIAIKQHLLQYQKHDYKTYCLQTPSGATITTSNLQHFCRQHNISIKALYHTRYRKKPCSSGKTAGWMILSTLP